MTAPRHHLSESSRRIASSLMNEIRDLESRMLQQMGYTKEAHGWRAPFGDPRQQPLLTQSQAVDAAKKELALAALRALRSE